MKELEDDSRFDFSAEELRRLENRWKSDVDLKLNNIYERLQTIERLVWMAVGGTAVIGSLAVFGISGIIKQGDKLDAVAVKQSSAITQREAHVESLKQRDADIQQQIDRLRDRMQVSK